ncbi:MAG: hypothetical protein RMJ82_06525 [Gemmatales bacterium]|nr:hypothetical protein [Gemmatales bacterium]
MREEDLYPQVGQWLLAFLKEYYPKFNRLVLPDTHQRPLKHVLQTVGLAHLFPELATWDVRVDIVGLVQKDSQKAHLFFVELKLNNLRLIDVGQLLVYSRVCKPTLSLLLSPRGLTEDLSDLLVAFRRLDILGYQGPPGSSNCLHLGKWNLERCEPEMQSLVPPLTHYKAM